MKVFLSHPSRLKPLLRELRNELPSFLEVWLDEDSLLWGDNLEDSIHKEIQSNSDFVLIFLDDHALRSEWVNKELDWALQQEFAIGRKFLLPILTENIQNSDLPQSIRSRVQLRLSDHKKNSVQALSSQIVNELFKLVATSFISLSKANEAHLDARNFCDRVAGYWWTFQHQVFDSAGFATITTNKNMATIALIGRAYNLNGDLHAFWESTAGCVNTQEKKFYYYWKGLHPSTPNEQFQGLGEITFHEFENKLETGVGIFSDTNLAKLESTTRKTSDFRRCTQQEAEIMRGGDKNRIAALIRQKLSNNNLKS